MKDKNVGSCRNGRAASLLFIKFGKQFYDKLKKF